MEDTRKDEAEIKIGIIENKISEAAAGLGEVLRQEECNSELAVIPKAVLNPCQYCTSQFETPEILGIHSHIHCKDGQFPTSCPVCHQIFAPGRKLSKAKQKRFISHINAHIKESIKEYKYKKYSCTVCGRPMHKEYQLRTHMRVHTNEKPFACTMCNKSFKQRAGLFTHMNSTHMKITFDCQVCQGTFSTKSSIMRHMKRIHAKGLTVSCLYCKKFVKDEASLRLHIDLVHGKRINLKSCNFCGVELPIMSMRQHVRNHRAKGEIVDMRVCLLCKAAFLDQQSYSQHVNEHIQYTTSDFKEALKNKAFHCRFCSRNFPTRYRLLSHTTQHIYQPLGMKFRHSILDVDEDCETRHHKYRRKNHSQTKKCEKCNKNVGSYKDHPRKDLCGCHRVNSITLHKCKICERLFHNKHSLSKHHLAHQCEAQVTKSISNTYFCKMCKKTVKNFTSFCKHIHRHKVRQKYKCRSCHKGFCIKERRDVHVKTQICRKFLASIERSMEHSCSHCSKKFFSKVHLDIHLTYHSIEYMVCRFCGVDFREFKLVRDHMVQNHPGENVAYCRYCDIGFDTFEDIKIHMFDMDHLMRSDSEIKRMSDFDNLELLEGIVQLNEIEEELVY